VHLVGFIIRIYHDARSSKCQIPLIYPSTRILPDRVQGYLHRFTSILSMRHSQPSASPSTWVWRLFECNVNLCQSACAVLGQHEQEWETRATKWTSEYMWRAPESKSEVFYIQYVRKGSSKNIVKCPTLRHLLSRMHKEVKSRRVSENAQSFGVGIPCRSYKKTCLIWVWNLVSYIDRIVCNEKTFRNKKTASNNHTCDGKITTSEWIVV
jgi:hypothetical protein